MALTFAAASTQYLNNAAAVLSTTPITMHAWVNITTAAASSIIRIGTAGTNNHCWGMEIDASPHFIAFCRTTSANSATGATIRSTGTWYSVVARFGSATDREIYVNGVSDGTSVTSAAPSGVDETEIGRRTTPGNYLSGQVAEVGIWSASLDAAEIVSLAKGICPRMVRPGALEAYWPLIGNASPEPDHIGRFDMTLNATPTKSAHPRVYYPTGLWVPPKATAAAGDAVPQAWVQYRSRRVA